MSCKGPSIVSHDVPSFQVDDDMFCALSKCEEPNFKRATYDEMYYKLLFIFR
jgi:hypothetical protein